MNDQIKKAHQLELDSRKPAFKLSIAQSIDLAVQALATDSSPALAKSIVNKWDEDYPDDPNFALAKWAQILRTKAALADEASLKMEDPQTNL